MKQFSILLICIMVLSGAACLQPGISIDRPVYIHPEVVYRGMQCNGPEKGPSAEWILDAAHLSVIYSRLNRHFINPKTIRPPEVNFSTSILLLVDMGWVPSSGYGIDLADGTIPVVRGTAGLHILWTEPASDSLQAQVVGSPCVMIKLPKAVYDSVSLTDQNDKTLLKRTLPVK